MHTTHAQSLHRYSDDLQTISNTKVKHYLLAISRASDPVASIWPYICVISNYLVLFLNYELRYWLYMNLLSCNAGFDAFVWPFLVLIWLHLVACC